MLGSLTTIANEPRRDGFDINRLMERLAQVPESHARFTEAKYIALLIEPLTLSGTLSYVRPNHVEKHVLTPYNERMAVDGDTLTIENQTKGVVHTLALPSNPLVLAFVESIRATLAGDLASLSRYYRIKLEGDEHRWLLSLYPEDSEIARYVSWIRIDGADDKISGMEIQETGGDRSVMTIVADVS